MAVQPLADNPFWDFSVALYANETIAQQCQALQDDWDADVNLLLYGIWLAHFGIDWPIDDIKKMQAEFEPWRKVALIPLRTVRRRLRFQTRRRYYNFLKNLELRAERYQQDRLWLICSADYTTQQLSEPVSDDLFQPLLKKNLHAYLQRLEMRPRPEPMHPKVDEQLEILFAAVIMQRASSN